MKHEIVYKINVVINATLYLAQYARTKDVVWEGDKLRIQFVLHNSIYSLKYMCT